MDRQTLDILVSLAKMKDGAVLKTSSFENAVLIEKFNLNAEELNENSPFTVSE
jgi:hypothetical protein